MSTSSFLDAVRRNFYFGDPTVTDATILDNLQKPNQPANPEPLKFFQPEMSGELDMSTLVYQ